MTAGQSAGCDHQIMNLLTRANYCSRVDKTHKCFACGWVYKEQGLLYVIGKPNQFSIFNFWRAHGLK